MFSFAPLPVIDTLNCHDGFWILMAIVGLINLAVFSSTLDYDKWTGFIICFVLSVCFMNYAGYKSWTTGSITVPKNEQVVGTLKGFNAEGEAYKEKSGKTYVHRENHYLYVVYSIEGYGPVLFKAQTGVSYPEKAILYKN